MTTSHDTYFVVLSSIKGITQSLILLSFPQTSFYNLGMLWDSLLMSHTITFTTGENDILGTSVKYWKVGNHGMSMSALVFGYIFSSTWGILQ